MTYSSFGRRLGAYLIDFLLLSPLFALQIWASGHSISMAILSAVLVSVAFIGYRVYCHAIWGQTVGKRVAKLRVVWLSGEAIGWRESWLRSSVEMLFTGLTLITQLIALATIPAARSARHRRSIRSSRRGYGRGLMGGMRSERRASLVQLQTVRNSGATSVARHLRSRAGRSAWCAARRARRAVRTRRQTARRAARRASTALGTGPSTRPLEALR